MNEDDLRLIEDRWPRRMSDYHGNDVHKLITEVRRLRGELDAANKLVAAAKDAFTPSVDFFEGKAMIPSEKAWKIIFAIFPVGTRVKDTPGEEQK